MTVPRTHLRGATIAYLHRHPHEAGTLTSPFNALSDPTSRTTYPAHVTCRAVVINDDDLVLHIHHKATGIEGPRVFRTGF